MLAATLLLGQVQEVQIIPQPLPQSTPGRPSIFSGFSQSSTVQQQPQQSRPLFPWLQREERPSWKSKMQGWFGRKDQQEPPLQQKQTFIQPQRGATTIIEGIPTNNSPLIVPSSPTPLDFPKKMPSPSSQNTLPKEIPFNTASATKPVQQTNLQTPMSSARSPILPQLADKIGRDEKFAWITGQLEVENGMYVLYYATPETVDQYNGRIVLQPQQADMSSFRRGSLVSVNGDVIQRQTAQGNSPAYRVRDIQRIDP